MTTPSDSTHNIDTNIERINQNVNNIYSMLNIMSNSIILNQLNDIRRPRPTPTLLTPNIFSNPSNSTTNTHRTPSTSNPTSNTTSNTTPSNSTNTTPSNSTNTPSNPFTNLFSSLLRNEGFPIPVGMGIGNMEISVLRQSEPEPNIVISHHNIFNNTKIKLKTCEDNVLEQCTICLADIENNQIIREINKCKHNFHVECSDKWFEEHITCPHCRQDIRIEMVD
jgi:hypothetical protein